jgi:hypothetical protein
MIRGSCGSGRLAATYLVARRAPHRPRPQKRYATRCRGVATRVITARIYLTNQTVKPMIALAGVYPENPHSTAIEESTHAAR